MKHYFVYIITNWNNKVLYVGVTNDILRRTGEHKLKMNMGFMEKYNLNKLVYFKEFGSITDAIKFEKKIKGWTRAKKNELVKSINSKWEDLFSEAQFYSGTLGIIQDPSSRRIGIQDDNR